MDSSTGLRGSATESSGTDGPTRFDGRLIQLGDAGYEEARVARIWHSRHPERRPAAILLASSERDIVEGVRLARERGWSVAVRSGGHSFPVWSLRDGGLMIDLGGFKEMSYDPETRIVTATTSVQGGFELNPFLKQHGRFFAGGGCPSVGIGGFLVQGGIGWNFRGWGYACENVVAIDVVTADGELVRADETQNSDLFWLARGIGPGFCGVITRFHLDTRPEQRGMAMSMQAYPVERYAEVLRWLWAKNDELSADVYLSALSVRPPLPVPGHDGSLVFLVWGLAFCDTLEASQAALTPLNDCPYLGEAIMVVEGQPTNMDEQYVLLDRMHPHGPHYRVDSAWVDGSREQVIASLRTLCTERDDEDIGYTFLIFTMPGRQTPDMAMSLTTELMVGTYVIYEIGDADERLKNWLQGAMAPLESNTLGQYWGDSDQLHREVKCLTDASWLRAQNIRLARDPDGVFALHLADGLFQNRNGWQWINDPADIPPQYLNT